MLDRLITIHGAPGLVRTDNGTDMTSNAVADRCRPGPTGIVIIDPGAPWQNAHVESLTDRLRDEFLTIKVFHTLLQATIIAEDYRQHDNTSRPHSSLGYLTPDESAPQWTNTNPGPANSLAHQPGAGQPRTRKEPGSLSGGRSVGVGMGGERGRCQRRLKTDPLATTES